MLGILLVMVMVVVVVVVGVAVQSLSIYLVVISDSKGFDIVVMSSTIIGVAKGFSGFLDLWKEEIFLLAQ